MSWQLRLAAIFKNPIQSTVSFCVRVQEAEHRASFVGTSLLSSLYACLEAPVTYVRVLGRLGWKVGYREGMHPCPDPLCPP